MIRDLTPLRLQQRVPLVLAWIGVFAYTLAVVALFASGRFLLPQAGILLSMPAVLGVALLRPEWMILVLAALPPFVGSVIPPMQLTALLIATIFGFWLQSGIRLGPTTGIYPLLAIIGLATLHQADVSLEVDLIAEGVLKTLLYYTSLMLAAFLAVKGGRLSIDAFVSVFLVGLVVAAALEPFFGQARGFGGVTQTPYHGKFAYLAAMGFGLSYVRFSIGRSIGDRSRVRMDAILTVLFLSLAAIGFVRAAWIATLWIFALASLWARKKAFWVAGAFLLVLVLTVPVIGERVLPVEVSDLGDPGALTSLTTGRSELWEELWQRATDALPWGQGWGYVPSLDSVDIFGFEGSFQEGEGAFVYPHNDFLYVFVELGVIGLGLFVLFWLSLLRRIRVVSRSSDARARYNVRVLAPVVITMLVVQLFDNGFAIRFVATPFFITAGLIAGLYAIERDRGRVEPAGSRSPDTTRDSGSLAGRS